MREELKRELRRDFEQTLESMSISQQHTPMQQDEVLPTLERVSTKGSSDWESVCNRFDDPHSATWRCFC